MKKSTLKEFITKQPYPLLFTTISGAHLYGFPSPDSDFDLRGVHILPVQEVVGLNEIKETIEVNKIQDNLEIDLVTQDLKKFFNLLLGRNGNVLEQLYSPLILQTTPEHEELKSIANNCITRYHAYHYLGFAKSQWKLFTKAETKKIKPLLYVYRVLLTGIYLMNEGIVEANLNVLNQEFKLSYLDDLIAKKLAEQEKTTIENTEINFYQQEYERLTIELETAFENSRLPEEETAKPALNDLLIRLRMKNI
ncbi:MAG: DNA polymerase beta superfamily protein [Prochloraceae cyanobacterium]